MSIRLVLVSLLVAGCGADGGATTPDAGDSERAFSQLESTLVGKALAVGLEDTANRYGPVTASGAFNVGCASPSGDTTDDDGDSIPVSAKLTFDCNASRLGYSGSLTGIDSVTDDQPNAAAWAFTAATDLHLALSGPFGGEMVVDTDGSVVASQASVLGPFDLTSELDVVTVITNVRGIETEILETLDATVTYTPDVEWTIGGPSVLGYLDADGAWNVSIHNKDAAATLSTPTPLRFRPGCNTKIVRGVVEASFAVGERSATISVEWTDCGQRRVGYYLDEPVGGA